MTRIGDVWDSTTDVLAGRAAPLAQLAALAFVLPSAIQSAARLFGGASPGAALLAAVIGLVALFVTLWGQLAVIAIASDPATTPGEARRQALASLPATLLVALVLAAGALVLTLPMAIALAASGYDFAAASAAASPAAMPPFPAGTARFVLWYSLVLTALLLWLGARLFLTNAVILNERRKIGALGRSWSLTRGLALKLIGVVLVFGAVLFVVERAVQPVVGLVFRLLLGPEDVAVAAFFVAVAGAAVFAAFLVVTQVFAARLYAAVTGAR